VFGHCVGHTEVSELSLWKGIYFGDGSSTLVVLRESPILTEWPSHALGFGSPTVPIYYESY